MRRLEAFEKFGTLIAQSRLYLKEMDDDDFGRPELVEQMAKFVSDAEREYDAVLERGDFDHAFKCYGAFLIRLRDLMCLCWQAANARANRM